MNIKIFSVIIIYTSLTLFQSCSNSNDTHKTKSDIHEGHNHEADADEHDHSAEAEVHNHGTVSYTKFLNGYELFMEMQNMIVRETAELTIHITRLADYKPISAHEIQVSLNSEKTYKTNAHNHQEGIYHASIKPNQTGAYTLKIEFVDNDKNQQFTIDSVIVFLNHDKLPSIKPEDEGLISYLKEQAWKQEFGVFQINSQPFSRVIKTSGEILPAPGDETIITAMHSGSISLKNTLIEGKKVKKGEVISIISSNLIHENLTNTYLEAKNKYEKAKIDYNRSQKLIDEKLISEKEYLEAKLNYKSTKNNFNNIAKFYSDGNQIVKASTSGYIRSVFVSEGQYIQEGQPIATIVQNKKVILKADIPQQYNHLASGFYSANFSPVYSDKLFSTKKLNGKRISYSLALPENSLFTSINFEFDANNEIIPGSYCEVYLKSVTTHNTLIVPVSALMEDQGNYFVFAMIDGEHYKKTYITIGNSDGEYVELLSGINEGNYVVSKGTYQVFLTSLGNAAPAHTHSH